MAASAAPVAGTGEIRQMGDVTVGERRDYNLAVLNTEDTAMALLSETTTEVAAAPVEESVEVAKDTPVGTYTREHPFQHTDNYQSINRDRKHTSRTHPPVKSTSRHPPTQPTPQPHPPAPPPYQEVANREHRRCVGSHWDKYCRRFNITWVVLASFLGIAGALFVGLGELTRKCDVPSKHTSMFRLWTSSFATGGIMILFTMCVWLASLAHYCCFKNQRDLCMGLVTGCGVVALFFFIIAYGLNISSVGRVVDTPPSGTNSTNHDSDCLSPYWLAYIPSFALGVVIVLSTFNLFCCLCCGACVCYRHKGYKSLH